MWASPEHVVLAVAILSVSKADCMPVMSPRLLPVCSTLQAALHAATSTPVHPAVPGGAVLHAQTCQVLASASVVDHSHLSIAQHLTIRMVVPDTLDPDESLWSLLCHAPQLAQTLVGLVCMVSTRCPLAKRASTQVHDIYFCDSCPTEPPPLPSGVR